MALEASISTRFMDLPEAYIRVNTVTIGLPLGGDPFLQVRYSVFASSADRSAGRTPIPDMDGQVMVTADILPNLASVIESAYTALKLAAMPTAKDLIEDREGGKA